MSSKHLFTHFIKHNGFVYEDSLSEKENFQRLVKILNLPEKGIEKLWRKHFKRADVLGIREEKGNFSISKNAFAHFIKFNGFVYDEALSEEKNFKLLIDRLNLSGKAIEKFKKKFFKRVETSINPNKKEENQIFSKECFAHYIKHHGFVYEESLTEEQNFQALVKKMKLSQAGIETIKKKFMKPVRLEENEKSNPSLNKSFFNHFIKHNGFVYDETLNNDQNLSRLV